MSPRSRGGIGPTSSPMKVHHKSGALGFSTHDPAHGTPSTNAPSYYDQHERWKQNLSEEDLKNLLWCLLPQHYAGKRKYKIDPKVTQKLKCPEKFTSAELSWLKQQDGYEFIANQVYSNHLRKLLENDDA